MNTPRCSPSAAANEGRDTATVAGRRLRLVGACYLFAGLWLSSPVWVFAYGVGGEALGALGQPGHLIIWASALVALLVAACAALGAAVATLALPLAHRTLGRAVAAGEGGAATRAFVFVAMELAGWAIATYLSTVPAAWGRAGSFRLPETLNGWMAVAMLGLSAWLLFAISGARRFRAQPPPLPRRVLPMA